MLDDVKRLYELGFAIHLLYPKTKKPIGKGWSKAPRALWQDLVRQYRPGMNVGVRLGRISRVSGGYLAVIDCDLRSKDTKDRSEMMEAFKKAFPALEKAPQVESGRANGSFHIYVVTKEPIKECRIAASRDTIIIKDEKGKERNTSRWSIVLMGEGRQVVLPPSVHPTGKCYVWGRPVNGSVPELGITLSQVITKPLDSRALASFSPEVTDLNRLSRQTIAGIVDGENVRDRSVFILYAVAAMVRARYTENQILSVFTNKDYYIGQAAYDHSRPDRQSAAQWIAKYTLPKARIMADPRQDFLEEHQDRWLSEEETNAQWMRLVGDWRSTLERNQYGGIKKSYMNALKILEGEFGESVFYKDTFAVKLFNTVDLPWGAKIGEEIKESDYIGILTWIASRYKVEFSKNQVMDAVIFIATKNSHNPAKEKFESLEWDGVSRLDTMFKTYFKADGDDRYLAAIGRKMMCAVVARVYSPGIKFDHMVILEGLQQGEGKSRSIEALAGEWCGTVRFDMDHKDFVLALQGRLISELPELSGLSYRDKGFVKAVISETKDRIRVPYGRTTETLPRQGIFIGTTNHFDYLEDETGNRRMWPVRIKNTIDVEALKRDRDQLFAEAVFTYEMGETLYLDKETEKLAAIIQSDRMNEDVWMDKLEKYFDNNPEGKEFAAKGFRIEYLFDKEKSANSPLVEERATVSNTCRIKKSLRRLGFSNEPTRKGDRVIRCWKR